MNEDINKEFQAFGWLFQAFVGIGGILVLAAPFIFFGGYETLTFTVLGTWLSAMFVFLVVVILAIEPAYYSYSGCTIAWFCWNVPTLANFLAKFFPIIKEQLAVDDYIDWYEREVADGTWYDQLCAQSRSTEQL